MKLLMSTWIMVMALTVGLAANTFGQEVRYSIAGTATSINYGATSASEFKSVFDVGAGATPAGSVDNFTGQHKESFPLCALSGRGGIGLSLALDYDGNVSRMAREENHIIQASPFGLGFSLGIPSILSDPRGTTDISDDFYFLIEDNNKIPLTPIDDSLYVLQDARPWVIIRQYGNVHGITQVIGWTIKCQDASQLRFGDHTATSSAWNATRNVMFYGHYVGTGVTQSDQPYAVQWDLKHISDVEGKNVLTFTYLQERAHIRVSNDGISDTSQFRYTQASYVERIEAPDGAELLFLYSSPRSDVQIYYGSNNYEFYQKKHISEIRVLSSSGVVSSRINFTFGYLNSERGSMLKKLLLTSITRQSGDATLNMPAVRFEYVTDSISSIIGSIRRIYYPSGSFKSIHYSTLHESENYSTLDIQIADSAYYDYGNQGDRSSIFVSDNQFLQRDLYGTRPVLYGRWDGYWHIDSLDWSVNMLPGSVPAMSPDGWFAFCPADSNRIILKRWMDGYWRTEEVADTIWPRTDRVGTSHVPVIVPGENCFLYLTGYWNDETNGRALNTVHYFRWDGVKWNRFFVGSGYFIKASGYKLIGDRFILKTEPDGDVEYILGGYDNTTKTMICDSIDVHDAPLINPGPLFAGGPSYFAFANGDSLCLADWTGSAWVLQVMEPMPDSTEVHTVEGLPGGPAITLSSRDIQPIRYYSGTVARDGSGWKWFSLPNQSFSRTVLFAGANHYLYQQLSGMYSRIFKWNDTGWVLDHTTFVNEDYAQPYAFGEMYSIAYPREAYVNNYTRRFAGNGTWDGTYWFSQDVAEIGATDDYIVYAQDPDIWFRGYRPFYIGGNAITRRVDTLQTGGSTCWGTPPRRAQFYCLSDNFYREMRYVRDMDPGPGESCRPWKDVFAHKLLDTLFSGKPEATVVSEVRSYRYIGDPKPARQQYNYYAGLLDASARNMNFGKVRVTLPYDGTYPEAYTYHYYYNDIDSADFTDPGVWSKIPRDRLNLTDANRFGVDNGGYSLDGVEYLSHTFTAGDSETKCQDTSISYFSIVRPFDTLPDVQRMVVDSTHAIQDSLPSDKRFHYDSFSGQTTSTWRRYVPAGTWLIDSLQYGFKGADSSSFKSDNALSQVISRKSFLRAANGTYTLLSRDSTAWIKSGSWRPNKSFVWRDPNSGNGMLIDSFPTSGAFDGFGNVLCRLSVDGTYKASKYAANGAYATATALNARPEELLVQDFEQPTSWDNWSTSTGAYASFVGDTAVHSGYKAFRLLDNPSTTEKNWGPSRIISRADLTDTMYYFSGWAKANHNVLVFCFCVNDAGQTCSGGYKYLTFDSAKFGDGQWTRIEGLFDLHDQMALGSTCFTKLKFQVVLADDGSAVPGDYVVFDDLRFHPYRASVLTSWIDLDSGLCTVVAGADNLPATTIKDKLGRAKEAWDARGKQLSDIEYWNPIIRNSIDLEIGEHYPETGRKDTTVFIDSAQTITWEVHVDQGYADRRTQAALLHNGTVVRDFICQTDCYQNAAGTLAVLPGDALRIIVDVESNGNLRSPDPDWDVYVNLLYSQPEYDPEAPEFTRKHVYVDSMKTSSSVSFYDSWGRLLQSRVRDSVNTEERIIVSGISTVNARGQVVRSYKSYHDLVSPIGLNDYSSFEDAVAEANHYYSDTANEGSDCGGYPFIETAHNKRAVSRVDSLGGEGVLLQIASTRPTKFLYGVGGATADTLYGFSRSIDPDSVVSEVIADLWGRYELKRQRYEDTLGNEQWIEILSENDISSRLSITKFNTGTAVVSLDSSHQNAIGLNDWVWKVDYGKVRMLYDRVGNLRFMQNDKRLSEHKSVYFKYDKLGRKVEEGIVSDTFLTQEKADDPNAPDSQSTVAYRWFYDYYKRGAGAAIVAQGKLVRVESGDTLYYRNYRYYLNENCDEEVVKLPQGATGKKKIIRHYYNADGTIRKLVVYPDSAMATSYRVFDYTYDAVGRLQYIRKGWLLDGMPHLDTLTYVSYIYNPDGAYRRVDLGRYDSYDILRHDTVQSLDYKYTPPGWLESINNVTQVSGALSGSFDHFGMKFNYFPDSSQIGYYNGRVRSITTANSAGGSPIQHVWKYTYNDLGWLSNADDTVGGNAFDQVYYYTPLGQRARLINGGSSTINYTYDAAPGSSKLISITGSAKARTFDELGNLTSDSSRGVNRLIYDHRNLLVNSYSAPNIQGGVQTNVVCVYDETGQRVKKGYSYNFWADCPGPDGGLELQAVGNEVISLTESQDTLGTLLSNDIPASGEVTNSSIPSQCLYTAAAATYYLYDGGVLLATFDHTDKVIDMFVNGSSGRIASYYQNKDSLLYYFVTDQVGSTRLAVKGVPKQTPQVAEYYNYYPFGETQQSWGNYPTTFKFSSKEHDQHGGFNFHYFGARYYDPSLGQFSSIDAASQFADRYLYGGNNPISSVDPDGNFAWFLFDIFLVAGAEYNVGMAVHAGLEEGGWGQALSNGLLSAATSILSYKVGAFLDRSTQIGARAATSAINSSSKSVLYGSPVTVDFGIGSLNADNGTWHWADFSGNIGSDLQTISGWVSFAQDYNKLSPYIHMSAADRKKVDDISKKYPGHKKSFDEDYPESPIVDPKTGETVNAGGKDISQKDYETLIEIGEKYKNHVSILDPVSWIPGLRKLLGKVGRAGGLEPGSVHESGERLPQLVVTQDIDKGLRIHGCINTRAGFGLGVVAHILENNLPRVVRQVISTAYYTDNLNIFPY